MKGKSSKQKYRVYKANAKANAQLYAAQHVLMFVMHYSPLEMCRKMGKWWEQDILSRSVHYSAVSGRSFHTFITLCAFKCQIEI